MTSVTSEKHLTDAKEASPKKELKPSEKSVTSDPIYVPRRIILAILCCTAMVIIHAMRVNIAITVVTILDEAPHKKVGSDRARESLPNVDWNSKMIGLLHSIFYCGFLITQIPGGYVSTKISGTRIFGSSILISCALNLLLPISIVEFGFVITCVVRFMQGLSEGFVVPALYSMMNSWFRAHSIHKYGGWILGGMYAGPIIGFPVGGALTHYVNWKYVYYLHGGVGILWFVFWFFLAYESPNTHPTISQEELKLILSDKPRMKDANVQIPWKEIFKSIPVWAIVACHFVKSWFFFLMLTNEPMYLNQFHFSLVENGIFSALPHVLKVLMSFMSGYLADAILSTNKVSKTVTRKLFTALGFGTEAACCYVLFFVEQGHVAIAFLSLGICVSGLAVSGWQINHLDLAPDFASVLVGLSATVGTVGGILSPIIVGLITHPQTLENWQKSFILSGSVLLVGSIIYIIFGSGERQPWADSSESKSVLTKESQPKTQVKADPKDS